MGLLKCYMIMARNKVTTSKQPHQRTEVKDHLNAQVHFLEVLNHDKKQGKDLSPALTASFVQDLIFTLFLTMIM